MIDGDECGAISAMDEWQGKLKHSEETCPSAGLFTKCRSCSQLIRTIISLFYQPLMIDDDDYGAINGMKTKYSEETCPSVALSITYPTWTDPLSNSGLRDEKPATNLLRYSKAKYKLYFETKKLHLFHLYAHSTVSFIVLPALHHLVSSMDEPAVCVE
jgi:hypothetical protein